METTQKYGYSNLDNTTRLNTALKGKPLKDVKCFLSNPQNVDNIRSLEFLYGRPELLLENALQKIKNLRTVNENDIYSLVPMSIEIQQIVCIFEQMPNKIQHLNNPIVIRDIVYKLPPSKREQWTYFSFSLGRSPNLQDLCCWINQHASVIRLITVQNSPEATDWMEPQASRRKIECYSCNLDHSLFKCPKFKSLSVSDRWKLIKRNKLCHSCFRSSHSPEDCRSKQLCGIDNCVEFHNRFLHDRKNLRSNLHKPNPSI